MVRGVVLGVCIVSVVALTSARAAAQEAPNVQVFAGYSYLRLDGLGLDKGNLSGWGTSGTVSVNKWLGAVPHSEATKTTFGSRRVLYSR